MAAPNARTTGTPDFMTSATTADILAAELLDHAEQVEKTAAEEGQARVQAARVRGIKRAAAQLVGIHQGGE